MMERVRQTECTGTKRSTSLMKYLYSHCLRLHVSQSLSLIIISRHILSAVIESDTAYLYSQNSHCWRLIVSFTNRSDSQLVLLVQQPTESGMELQLYCILQPRNACLLIYLLFWEHISSSLMNMAAFFLCGMCVHACESLLRFIMFMGQFNMQFHGLQQLHRPEISKWLPKFRAPG